MRPASSGQILNPFLDVARTLALEAGAKIVALRQSPLVQNRKPDHSLVTNADHEADRIVREGLRKAFPEHSILTEESGLEGPVQADYLWVVDPLDGTRAYAKGVTGYSVMVGLLKDGLPHAGVVFDPLEGHLYEAVRGEGAYHTFGNIRQKARVSSTDEIRKMPVITSTGFPKTTEDSLRQRFSGRWIAPVNSVGVKIGYMVRGLVDIYVNHHSVHYWDTCAPQIILEEAGGTITFLDGTGVNYSFEAGTYQHRGPTVATNAKCHEDILTIIRSLKPPLS